MEKKKYEKITKEDVLNILVKCAVDELKSGHGLMNVINIASLLKTSKYQVRKYTKELRNEGLIKLICEFFYSDEELYPPYWGYVLTEKGMKTDLFAKEKAKWEKWFAEWIQS